MIKSALFTIGILATLGGFGIALLGTMAAGMSDNTQASNEAMGQMGFPFGIGCVGVAMIVGAILFL